MPWVRRYQAALMSPTHRKDEPMPELTVTTDHVRETVLAEPGDMEGLYCVECGTYTDTSGWCPCQER